MGAMTHYDDILSSGRQLDHVGAQALSQLEVPMLLRRRTLLCLLMVSLICGQSMLADDWPQILGPARSGTSSEKLPDRFPSGGPKVVWSAPAGQGYAGPAVADGKVIVFHRV